MDKQSHHGFLWEEISHPGHDFDKTAVEIMEQMSNYIPLFLFRYQCLNSLNSAKLGAGTINAAYYRTELNTNSINE